MSAPTNDAAATRLRRSHGAAPPRDDAHVALGRIPRGPPRDGYEYSQFCQLYRDWREKLDVTMRQDHKAGEKMFVDFPGLTIPIYDERNRQLSRRAVRGRARRFQLPLRRGAAQPGARHWCHAHENAFESFGGCPQVVVPDNLRSGVTKPHRYEPDPNATYQEMAQHYGVVIIPARPYKPRDKAKVEVGVQIAERWIIVRLRNERFTSLAEAERGIGELSRSSTIGPSRSWRARALASSPRSTPSAATAARHALRVRHLDQGQGQHRLPRRNGLQLLQRPLPTRRPGRRRAHDGEHDRDLRQGRRVASHKRSHARGATPPIPPTCPSPTGATPSGRRDASSPGPRRQGPRRPGSSRGSWLHGPIPSRASVRASASSASAAATGATAWRLPAPGRCRCGRSATAPSSPS